MANFLNSCSICLVNFPENTKFVNKAEISFSGDKALDIEQMKAIATKCEHVFHESCLAKWIEEYRSKTTPPPCPNCRKSLIEQSAIISPSSNGSFGGIQGLQIEQNPLELSLDELLSSITLAEQSPHSSQEPSSYESSFGANMPIGEFSQGLQVDQFPLEPAYQLFPSTPLFGQNPLMSQTSSNASSSWIVGGSSNHGLQTGMPSLHLDEPDPLTSILQNLLGNSGSSSWGSIPY